MFHLGPYRSTFDGGMVISEKKMSCRLIFEGKNSCKEIPAKKIPRMKKISFKTYKAGKKNLTPLYARKKFYHQILGKSFFYRSQITHTPTPSPQKSNG